MTFKDYQKLMAEIERHNVLYYEQDAPEISDEEFDLLTQKLRAIEAEHPDWVTPSSPSQHVGGAPAGNFQKVKHPKQLTSLIDLFDLGELKSWYENLGSPRTVVEDKVDGLTCLLTYRNGRMVQAATRGDGFVGELVTEQALQVQRVPAVIPVPANVPKENLLYVRVEVCITNKDFEIVNRHQTVVFGKKPFANPRNCASGGLRAKDPGVARDRRMTAVAFQIVDSTGWDAVRDGTQSGDIALLQSLGFKTVSQYACKNFDDILKAIDAIGAGKKAAEYWQDGAVVKIDDQALQKRIGATSKCPLHAMAYKYPAETAETTIRNIVVQVGRTGVLTPVAEFDPVPLGGTTVTRATLHNQRFVTENKINVGSRILVLKSGEIIPKVVDVLTPSETPYEITCCPECGAVAVPGTDPDDDSDTIVMVCPNRSGCKAQYLRYLEFFCSREVMDIRGLGPAMLETLYAHGLVDHVWDIYHLHEQQEYLLQLPGVKEKTVSNLLAAIEESKSAPMERVIKSLGIPSVGRHAGKILKAKYGSMDAFTEATEDELVNLDGIGPTLAANIVNFWRDPNNAYLYGQLKAAGIVMTATQAAPKGTIFNGLKFVITGTLPSMSRDEMKEIIEANGGTVSGSVSKKTSYLIAGDNAGSKLDKAQDLNIPILSEQELLQMLY